MRHFFGIGTNPSTRVPSGWPLPKAVQSALVKAFGEWGDAGWIAHPTSINGTKTPLNVIGGGKAKPDGTRDNGWAAIRDGEMPPFTIDRYAELVRRGQTDGVCIPMPLSFNGGMIEVEAAARSRLPKIAAAAKELGVYDLLEALVHGYSEESARGGLHFPFRLSTDEPVQRTQLAFIKTPDGKAVAAEVIAAGGQFIAAPSCGRTHPNGLPYTKIYGSPASILTITPEQQQLLYKAFASVDEVPRPPQVSIFTVSRQPLDDAVADFNQREPWRAILEPHGWVWLYARPVPFRDGRVLEVSYWTRPGKRHGVSASTCGKTLCSFSSSPETKLPQFDPGGSQEERGVQKQSKFEVYVALEHGGDAEAARDEIRRRGFGRPVFAVSTQDETADIQRLTDAANSRGADTIAAIREMIPGFIRPEVMAAIANRERRALGLSIISTDSVPSTSDSWLRAGFSQIAIRVMDQLEKRETRKER
jgi:hypothetical protein